MHATDPRAVSTRQIEVNTLSVRRALARSFVGVDPGDHAWRGRSAGDAVVEVDVLQGADAYPLVRVRADVIEPGSVTPGRLAQTLVLENGELVLGRFARAGSA